MDSALSKCLIPGFVKRAGIDLSQFESDGFRCFNDCFTRKIKAGLRTFDEDPQVLTSPCDGLLSAYPITDGLVMPIKQSHYSVASLLQDAHLAAAYEGGLCLVFRLCVEHYHRYSYFDDGCPARANKFIPGRLHTVRPIALETRPVFVENCREIAYLDTDHFGQAVQIEVGAMLVGKIANHPVAGRFHRGEEKGMFLYGGSTIVLLLAPGAAVLEAGLVDAVEEIPVRMGQSIGKACH